jgi:cytochrome c-type biogenesis protein CcmF
LASILLIHYFLESNFDIHYVWYNSSESVDWTLKLAGFWAGQEGSLLLWVWIIALSIGIEEIIQYYRRRKHLQNLANDEDDDEFEDDFDESLQSSDNNSKNTYDWTRLIVMLVIIVFMILLVMKDPFEPTHPQVFNEGKDNEFTIDPEDYPDGHGMNPMNRNFWMVIHPPLLFIGYGLITIPFAASISYSINDDKKWTKISLQWSRLAWLFLTLGIGIGALWAYVAIGWGGYWFWDAVEVGSLVPWITLSAFLHVQLMNKRKNDYGILTPIFGTVTFVLILFATFITRSGLWDSLHAWSESEVGQILMVTMVATLILCSIIILRALLLRWKTIYKRLEKLSDYKWDSIFMFGTIIIFIIFTIIVFYVLVDTMGIVNAAFYETKLLPFTIILLVVMAVCLCWRYFGKENSIYIIAWTALAGIACAALLPDAMFPGTPELFYDFFDIHINGETYTNTLTTHHIVGFMVPFVVLAIIASIFKMIKVIDRKSLRNSLKMISPHIIHLGVALIIIAYAASQTMVVEKKENLRVGESMDIDGYEIKVTKIEIKEDTGNKESGEYWDTWFIEIEIYKNGELVEEGKMNMVYSYGYDNQGRRYYTMIMSSEVYVARMAAEDLHISFLGVNDFEIQIIAQKIPMMSSLWLGMFLFVIGISIRIIIDSVPSKKRPLQSQRQKEEYRPSRTTYAYPPEKLLKKQISKKKTKEKDYDKLLEDELKRLRS